jgi:hypothetical protein
MRSFASTPCSLPRHNYLFTNKTLEESLFTPYNNMTAWLRSIDEAKLVLRHQEMQLHEEAERFFTLPLANEDNEDSTYSPSGGTSTTQSLSSFSSQPLSSDGSTFDSRSELSSHPTTSPNTTIPTSISWDTSSSSI